MYGQMFSNEQMKFNFKNDQSLTTFAYEVGKNHKEKIKKFCFVHIAKADLEGRITYHSFPRLIMYKDTDPLKTIAFKLFRGLRSTLSSCLLNDDPNFAALQDTDAFTQLFPAQSFPIVNQPVPTEPYELVLVLKDGSRWKLDCHQKQRLNQIVDPEMIVRVEAIFPIMANFEPAKEQFKREFERQDSFSRDLGLKDLNSCIRKYIRQCLVGGESMTHKCKDCKDSKGAQQVTELMKLSNILPLKINKVERQQMLEIPIRMQLDKYMSKNSGYYQIGNEYELIGGIDDSSDEKVAFVFNSKENSLIKYTSLPGQNQESLQIEITEEGSFSDNKLDFLIYKKLKKDEIKSSTVRK